MAPAGGARRRAVTVLVTVLAALVASLGLAAPASAHAQLVRSDPADGANLETAPAAVHIDLTQAVVPERTDLRLTAGTGRVTVLQPAIRPTAAGAKGPGLVVRPGDAGEPSTISAALPALGSGVYRLAWSTLSADDLHVTSGVVVFGIGTVVSGAVGEVADPLPPVAEVVLRWAALAGAALAAGGIGLSLALPCAGFSAVRRRALRTTVAGAGASALLSVGLLVDQTGSVTVAARTLDGSYGGAWLVRLACLGGAVTLAARPPRRARTALGVGAALLAGFAGSTVALGHVRAEGGPVRLVADGLHVAAAVTWVGLVVVLALTLRAGRDRVQLMTAVRRVGAVAACCLAVMSVTGLLLASSGLASLDALLLSTYGGFVAAKLVLVAVLLVVAAVTAVRTGSAVVGGRLRRAVLRLSDRTLLGRASLRHLVAFESAVLVVLVGLGAAAASSRPAVGAEWVPASAAVPLVSGQSGDLVETLSVSPNRPGRTFVTLDVFETRRPSPGPVTRLYVDAVAPDGRQARLDAVPQGEGRWLATTDALDEAGRWRLTVVAVRPGLPQARAGYDWTVLDPGARLTRPLLSSRPIGTLVDVAAGVVGAGCVLLGFLALRRRRAAGHDAAADGADSTGEPGADPGPEGEAIEDLVRFASEGGTMAVR